VLFLTNVTTFLPPLPFFFFKCLLFFFFLVVVSLLVNLINGSSRTVDYPVCLSSRAYQVFCFPSDLLAQRPLQDLLPDSLLLTPTVISQSASSALWPGFARTPDLGPLKIAIPLSLATILPPFLTVRHSPAFVFTLPNTTSPSLSSSGS